MFFGKNAIIHILLILVTAYITAAYSWWGLLIYPGFLLFSDLFYYFFAIRIFDPEERIRRGYEFASVYVDDPYGQGLDLGLNLYDGDYNKSRRQAQKDKWDLLIRELGLRPGMSLIDIGCGFGDWMDYAQSQGIKVKGVNMSESQVAVCRKRGLDVIWSNWKDISKNKSLRQELHGQFDAVTIMDAAEHFVPAQFRSNVQKQNKIYQDMFELAYDLLRPDAGSSRRVFLSCLHMKTSFNGGFRQLISNYLLDKYHSGCYPSYEQDQLVENANGYFRLLDRWDKTLDYYKTSELNPEHFGLQKSKWTWKRSLFFFYFLLMDPDWFHKWIYRSTNNWMNQFDAGNIEQSPMYLWWLLFERY